MKRRGSYIVVVVVIYFQTTYNTVKNIHTTIIMKKYAVCGNLPEPGIVNCAEGCLGGLKQVLLHCKTQLANSIYIISDNGSYGSYTGFCHRLIRLPTFNNIVRMCRAYMFVLKLESEGAKLCGAYVPIQIPAMFMFQYKYLQTDHAEGRTRTIMFAPWPGHSQTHTWTHQFLFGH